MIPSFMKDSYGMVRGRYFALGFFLVIVIAVSIVVFAARNIGIYYDHIQCNQFGAQANREVRFVSYNYWSWDCLTPSGDGRWISTDNLREFDNR